MQTQETVTPSLAEADLAVPISFISNSRLLFEGLSLLLAEHITFNLIAHYTSEAEQDTQLPNPDQHIVLLDSSIGQDNALLWTTYWCERNARVIVLEMLQVPETILACIEAGACGYTLRGASPAEVAKTIQLVQQDRALCSPQMISHLFRRIATLKQQVNQAGVACTPLTEREMDVLRCIADGMSNQEIANDLFISVRTVKFHVHNMLAKLNLNNRHEAAEVARKEGWISL